MRERSMQHYKDMTFWLEAQQVWETKCLAFHVTTLNKPILSHTSEEKSDGANIGPTCGTAFGPKKKDPKNRGFAKV